MINTKQFKPLAICLLSATFLSACSEGGGAGDPDNSVAVALIAPLVGLYSLPDNWAGTPLSEAYFEIQTPASTGVSTALIHQISGVNNCIEARPIRGEVIKDGFSDRVFLDNIFELDEAILEPSGNDILIRLPEDLQDTDADGDREEPVNIRAVRLGVMSIDDIGEFCT